MEITIFKNINETKTPYYVNLEQIIKRIKEGNSKTTIEKLRLIEDKKERNELKKTLPSICFSGKFSKRANDSILLHSGLVCIDFDHLFDPKDFKESLSKDKYTLSAFISPSGDGVKLLVKIPANISTHAASCRALKDYYKSESLDSFEDVARVCYESFDDEIFYNPNSEIFLDLIEEKIIKKEIKETVNDDFEIFTKLKKWIEKFENYSDGGKHKFLVKFAAALNRFGVNKYNSISYLKNTYQNKASFVDSRDFEKIVEKVYSNYLNHNNISYFDSKGYSIERKTGQRTSDDFFKEYEEIKIEPSEIEKIIENTLIDFSKPPIQLPVLMSIRKSNTEIKKVRLMTAGNISAIKGKAKSKKTYFLSMLCSSLVSNSSLSNIFYPTLDFNKNMILYIDTEQSKYDVWKVANRVKYLSGTDAINFGSFCMRGYESTDIIKLIKHLLEKIPQTSIIIIDQIADLTKSINDEKEAVAIIRFFEKLTIDYNMHICCCIHENPSKESNKAAGWLGTQILKKAETIITIEKDRTKSNISHVKADMTRGEDFEDFSFEIRDDGLPYILENYTQLEMEQSKYV